jgi:hypothetical protein
MIRKIINCGKRDYILSLTMALGLFLMSCTPVYRANTLFMPGFEEKGDFVAEASVGSSDVSINTGYAFSEKLALTGGFQTILRENEYKRGTWFAETGVAWYKKQREMISYEIMGGFGYGQTEISTRYKTIFGASWRERIIESNYSRLSMQSNIHFHVKPFTFSLGSRFSHLYFLTYEEILLNDDTGAIVESQNEKNFYHFFIEPNGTVSINIGSISLFSQVGFSFLTAGSPTIMDYGPYMLNLGIRVRLNKK